MNNFTSQILRRLLLLSTLGTGLLAFTHDAYAADPAPATKSADAPIAFADLPLGHFTSPPTKKVAGVAPNEKTPGLFVVAPPQPGVPPQHRLVSISTDQRIANANKSGEGFNFHEETPNGCVTENNRFFFGEESDEHGKEWSENLSPEAHAYMKSAENPMSGVVAIHSERLIEGSNGMATLEIVDAWVDPATRGARLIGKSNMPLKLVRGPIFGMNVYAGRDEHDGKKFVQFVVARPKTTKESSGGFDRTSNMWAMRQDGSTSHSSGCGHQRVMLPLDGKGGDLATVVATVILPPLDAESAPSTPASPAPPPPPPPPPVQAVQAKGGKGVSPTVAIGKPPPPKFPVRRFTGEAGTKEREIRSRMVHVQVSVSQTTKEKEPLVSVSTTWGNRETIDRVAEPTDGPAS